jgi:hypothetical protein
MYSKLLHSFTLFSIALLGSPSSFASATKTLSLSTECDKTITAEFRELNELHSVSVKIAAGDKFNVIINPIDDRLKVGLKLFEPSANEIDVGQENLGKTLNFESDVLSVSGEYQLLIRNFHYHEQNGRMLRGTIGAYELHIGCKKQN